MMNDRRAPFWNPVIAECLEGKGRYLPFIEQAIVGYCNDPTWASPGTDKSFRNYGKDPTKYFVELSGAQFAAQMAQVNFLLGNQLSKNTSDYLLRRINERIFVPTLAAIQGKNNMWWMRSLNNWNVVCWSNIVYTALATPILDRKNKNLIVTAAVAAIPYYMQSFTDEGFNTEGVWYFGFGFGPFSLMRELLAQATNNALDLYADKKVSMAALFPMRYPMRGNAQAAFGDSSWNQTFRPALVSYLKWAYGIEDVTPGAPATGIHNLVLQFIINTYGLQSRKVPFKLRSVDPSPLRTHFTRADTVVMRGHPANVVSTQARMDLTIKGGGNGANGHGHNDLGSYAVALDGVVVLGDPGGPGYYNATTFGPYRYQSPLLGSYGHPVPLIGGKVQEEAYKVLQSAGGKLPSKLTASNQEDRFIVDLTRAYKGVSRLRRVRRMAMLSRLGAGAVVIKDTVEYTDKVGTRLWEAPLTTYGHVTLNAQRNGGTVRIADRDGKLATVAFNVKASGGKVILDLRDVGSYNVVWKRLAIKMMATSKRSTITVTITPA
ncbi:hypothetical protein HDU96_009234 [Phlyctochytrium bullatum]|nr:hypothetical protein HDU96_009234 [Phlyctochytrium bullatum]